MNPIVKFILAATAMVCVVYACKRDELDIDKLSKTVEVERSIAVPLVYGDLKLSNLLGDGADSIITIEADTIFQDTVALNLPEQTQNFTIQYLHLPYRAKNYLPVGANIMLITYDSITKTVLDTIKFAQSGLFLNPAVLDNAGNPIEPVEEKFDSIVVDTNAAENLFRVATHLIIDARLVCDTTRIIPVNDKQRIWLKIGLDAKLTYKTIL
jgi:hypothetical protein